MERITSFKPGHKPPQVTIALRVRVGSKNRRSWGPAASNRQSVCPPTSRAKSDGRCKSTVWEDGKTPLAKFESNRACPRISVLILKIFSAVIGRRNILEKRTHSIKSEEPWRSLYKKFHVRGSPWGIAERESCPVFLFLFEKAFREKKGGFPQPILSAPSSRIARGKRRHRSESKPRGVGTMACRNVRNRVLESELIARQ